MRLISAALLLLATGCATSLRLDKSTLIVLTLGPTFVLHREVDAEAKVEANEPDTAKVPGPKR
jgi:hypothetical protein